MTIDFERQLKRAFVRAELPLAPDRLRQVLIDLPSGDLAGRSKPGKVTARSLPQQTLRLAAVLALFAVVAGAVLYGITKWPPQIGPGASPSPSPSPSIQASPTPAPPASLPEPAALLSQQPDAELAYERSEGPADRQLSDDATIQEIDVGPLEFARNIVLAAACLGPGELSVTIRYTDVPGAADPFVGLARPCDGQQTAIGYSGSVPGDDIEIEVITVSVPAGASWRFAIGEIPDPAAPPATLGPVSGTEGWWRLWDVELDAVDPSTGMGVGLRVADDVTRLGAWVECVDTESVLLDFVHDSPSSTADSSVAVPCTAGEPVRHELAVAAGEEISIKVTPAVPIAAHLYVEANAMPVSEWGEPPTLPGALADAPFMASNGSLVALGTLGGIRQTLVDVAGAGPFNRPGGDYAAIAINTVNGPSLRLYSVSSGEQLATLADHEAGTFIATTWVDALHEQVFYTVVTPSLQTLEAYRVALDGTGQTRLASVPSSGARSIAALSLDNETFLIDSCQALTCQRTIVDAATLEVSEIDFALDAEVCDSAGVTDGIVVLRVAESCSTTPAEELVVMDYEGTELLRAPDPGFVSLLRTADGPVLLVRDSSDGGLQVIDTATGKSTPLDVDAATLMPVLGVQLPADWVLLAPFSGIGDFPIHPSILLGNAPLLVNVATGETLEMINLPH